MYSNTVNTQKLFALFFLSSICSSPRPRATVLVRKPFQADSENVRKTFEQSKEAIILLKLAGLDY